MKQQRAWLEPLAAFMMLTAFYILLFYGDNKYQSPPPYGKSGIITIDEGDLDGKRPLFLIDGWLLTDERVKDMPPYIGEFSNLQRGKTTVSPHGEARYRLILRYEGAPRVVSVDFPQLSSRYSLSLNGTVLGRGTGSGRITFLLSSGDHILEVETSSKFGYYSGMYFPPAFGTAGTLSRMDAIRGFAYALGFLLPLSLAVFTLFLWQTGGSLSRWFGLLCCCYALYMFRYFVFAFSMPVAEYWFLVQGAAFYGLCFCVAKLTALASGSAGGRAWRWMQAVLLALPLCLIGLSLLIPVFPWAVSLHGRLTDLYYIFTFVCAAFFGMQGIRVRNRESRYTLTGCMVFGAGLLANLFFSNTFEPVYLFWQFEWCGLLLVLLFGAMMVSRNRRILRENDALTNHLEEEVKKRTQEVTRLLDERKAFFSDMAHDLKAPVFATQSFIEAIRKSGVGVDRELRNYLDLAEAKQQEMARRLQGLSAINELDKIKEEKARLSLREILSEIYAVYYGEAQVRMVYFFVEEPEQEAFLMAQPEKMNLLFENLIYNALRATPAGGKITVAAWIREDKICITVEDTGCGIPEEELPFIFRRFYVGANNRENGTGLGLYIAHSIVTGLGGAIYAESTLGRGTKFTLELPREN